VPRRRCVREPGGGTVPAYRTGFDAVCGVSVSPFGVPADQPRGPAPSPLTARITAGPARAGTDFGYLVTLANPTARTVPLRPCPSYAEFLDGIVLYYYLNCGAAPAVPARGSVTFRMRLRLPAGLGAAPDAKLDWQVQGGAGPAAAVLIPVDP